MITSVNIGLLITALIVFCGADVPICTHDTMGDHAFCFPPEYNKVGSPDY